MSVVMEDLGTKTQVAAPRHRFTSHTGQLIKHDQYCPPLLFIHLFISFTGSLLKPAVRSAYHHHNNLMPFFRLPPIDTAVPYLK